MSELGKAGDRMFKRPPAAEGEGAREALEEIVKYADNYNPGTNTDDKWRAGFYEEKVKRLGDKARAALGSQPVATEEQGELDPDTPEHWWRGCSKHYKRLEELSKEFPEQRKDLWAAAVCVSMAGAKIMELFKRIEKDVPAIPEGVDSEEPKK